MSVTAVAELGIHHNGSLNTALAMVWAAAQAGADAVKVQHFSAAEFCTPDAEYHGERQIDLFRRYELGYKALARIAADCERCHVIFFGTPDSIEHGQELVDLGAKWLKVGSDDLVNLPLIRGLVKLGKPMILSTGMASAHDIEQAVGAVDPDLMLMLMHCVSEYPTPDSRANLFRLRNLRARWSKVGYSDHTDGIEAAVLSVAVGATMVEKHFTLDRSQSGPDHAFSANPLQFAEMVKRIRHAEVLLGGGQIDPGPEELEMRKVARRSIVAARPIKAHAFIQGADLAFKRPGTGLSPKRAVDIIGRQATRDLGADEQIREGDWA